MDNYKTITCPGCDARWAGLRLEHCAGCHRSFSSTRAGDAHRTGEMGVSERCMTDTEIAAKKITSGPYAGQPWFKATTNSYGTRVWSCNVPGRQPFWSGDGERTEPADA